MLPSSVVRFETVSSLAALASVSVCVVACTSLAGISDSSINDTEPSTVTGPSKTGDERADANIVVLADLAFGDVPCGTEAGPKQITIKSTGGAPTSYKISLPSGTPFRIDGALSGPLDAHNSTVTLNVYAKPSIAGVTATDIAISAGTGLQPQKATTNGIGASLQLAPELVAFGEVRMQNGGGPLDVVAKNTGTAALVLSGFSSTNDPTSAFSVALDANPLTIPPGGTGKLHATFKGDTMPSKLIHADLKPTISQALCGAAPVLGLEGTRVNSNVTLSSGDFGKVDCVPQTNGKDIIISNYGSTPLNYTASVSPGGPFTIVSGSSGTVPAAGTTPPGVMAVRVQPKPFGTTLNTLTDTLTINITNLPAPDGGMRTVPLKVDVYGAVVTFTPLPINTFMSDGTTADTKPFTATNTGNSTIFLDWSLVRTAGGSAWTTSPPAFLGPGDSFKTNIDFKPTTAGDYKATLTASRSIFFGGAVACTPLQPIQLEGMKP